MNIYGFSTDNYEGFSIDNSFENLFQESSLVTPEMQEKRNEILRVESENWGSINKFLSKDTNNLFKNDSISQEEFLIHLYNCFSNISKYSELFIYKEICVAINKSLENHDNFKHLVEDFSRFLDYWNFDSDKTHVCYGILYYALNSVTITEDSDNPANYYGKKAQCEKYFGESFRNIPETSGLFYEKAHGSCWHQCKHLLTKFDDTDAMFLELNGIFSVLESISNSMSNIVLKSNVKDCFKKSMLYSDLVNKYFLVRQAIKKPLDNTVNYFLSSADWKTLGLRLKESAAFLQQEGYVLESEVCLQQALCAFLKISGEHRDRNYWETLAVCSINKAEHLVENQQFEEAIMFFKTAIDAVKKPDLFLSNFDNVTRVYIRMSYCYEKLGTIDQFKEGLMESLLALRSDTYTNIPIEKFLSYIRYLFSALIAYETDENVKTHFNKIEQGLSYNIPMGYRLADFNLIPAFKTIALIYMNAQNYGKSIQFSEIALFFNGSNPVMSGLNPEDIYEIKYLLGECYQLQGKMLLALNSYLAALEFYNTKKILNYKFKMKNLLALGELSKIVELNHNKKPIEYYQAAISDLLNIEGLFWDQEHLKMLSEFLQRVGHIDFLENQTLSIDYQNFLEALSRINNCAPDFCFVDTETIKEFVVCSEKLGGIYKNKNQEFCKSFYLLIDQLMQVINFSSLNGVKEQFLALAESLNHIGGYLVNIQNINHKAISYFEISLNMMNYIPENQRDDEYLFKRSDFFKYRWLELLKTNQVSQNDSSFFYQSAIDALTLVSDKISIFYLEKVLTLGILRAQENAKGNNSTSCRDQHSFNVQYAESIPDTLKKELQFLIFHVYADAGIYFYERGNDSPRAMVCLNKVLELKEEVLSSFLEKKSILDQTIATLSMKAFHALTEMYGNCMMVDVFKKPFEKAARFLETALDKKVLSELEDMDECIKLFYKTIEITYPIESDKIRGLSEKLKFFYKEKLNSIKIPTVVALLNSVNSMNINDSNIHDYIIILRIIMKGLLQYQEKGWSRDAEIIGALTNNAELIGKFKTEIQKLGNHKVTLANLVSGHPSTLIALVNQAQNMETYQQIIIENQERILELQEKQASKMVDFEEFAVDERWPGKRPRYNVPMKTFHCPSFNQEHILEQKEQLSSKKKKSEDFPEDMNYLGKKPKYAHSKETDDSKDSSYSMDDQ